MPEVRIHFGTVGRTMLSLYMAVTGGNDWALYFLIMEEIGAVSWHLACIRLSHGPSWGLHELAMEVLCLGSSIF